MNANTVTDNEKLISYSKPSLFGMIISPVDQFEKLTRHAPIWKPLLVLILLQTIVLGLAGYISADNQAMEPVLEHLDVSPERLQIVIGISSAVFGIFNMLFIMLIAAIFFKICMIFLQKDVPFKKIFALLIYVGIIPFLGTLLNLILSLLAGTTFKPFTNIAFLFQPDSVADTVFSSLDIFFLWQFALIGMGLYVLSKLSKVKTLVLMSVLLTLNISLGALFSYYNPG